MQVSWTLSFKSKTRLFRNDRNQYGDGLATYVCSDIPCKHVKDIESTHIETIAIELKINSTSWLVLNCYKPPSLNTDIFQRELELLLEQASSLSSNSILMGDLNCDLLKMDKGRVLTDITDIFNLENQITEPTFQPKKLLSISAGCAYD